MRSFKKILAIIEPRQMRQFALERALALLTSQKHKEDSKKIEVIAIMPCFDNSWDLTSMLSIEHKEDIQQQLIKKHEKWLDAYLRINTIGYDIKSKVIWSKSLGVDIVEFAKENSIDLIIKSADIHGILDSVIFTPLDWQLLRHSPIPVLVAKDHIWHPTGKIAVAINLDSLDDISTKLTNIRLLREAQELSQLTKCQIHLVTAIPPIQPPSSIDMPGYMPTMVSDEMLKESCKTILSFAHRHRIDSSCVHIREGNPQDVIPMLCTQLKPTALFIGTSARTGIASAVLGNICEKVIDNLTCDVAVITPKAVLRKIPTTNPVL